MDTPLKIATFVLSILTGVLLSGMLDRYSNDNIVILGGFFFGVLLIWWIYLLVDKAVKK